MIKNKNRGFVLAEAIVVAVFVLGMFTYLAINIFPLISKYDKSLNYDNPNEIYNINVLYDDLYGSTILKEQAIYTYDNSDKSIKCRKDGGDADDGLCTDYYKKFIFEYLNIDTIIIKNVDLSKNDLNQLDRNTGEYYNYLKKKKIQSKLIARFKYDDENYKFACNDINSVKNDKIDISGDSSEGYSGETGSGSSDASSIFDNDKYKFVAPKFKIGQLLELQNDTNRKYYVVNNKKIDNSDISKINYEVTLFEQKNSNSSSYKYGTVNFSDVISKVKFKENSFYSSSKSFDYFKDIDFEQISDEISNTGVFSRVVQYRNELSNLGVNDVKVGLLTLAEWVKFNGILTTSELGQNRQFWLGTVKDKSFCYVAKSAGDLNSVYHISGLNYDYYSSGTPAIILLTLKANQDYIEENFKKSGN